jgi:hypothetical protein
LVTVTGYQQLADDFMKALDALITGLPPMETSHPSTSPFVRGKLNIPRPFLESTVAAVEQSPELQALNKLDSVKGRETLQFLEAFRTVHDKLTGFSKDLKFTLEARHAALANDALQIYYLAKGVIRDPNSPAVTHHVENMKRDLARKGRKKAAPSAPQPPAPTT